VAAAAVKVWQLQMKLLLCVLIGCSQLCAGCSTRPKATLREERQHASATDGRAQTSPGFITVGVGGEVVKPGYLRLPANATVWDALQAAGGHTQWTGITREISLGRNGVLTRLVRKQQFDPSSGSTLIWFQQDNLPISPASAEVLRDGDALFALRD
jgi:SLBB domain